MPPSPQCCPRPSRLRRSGRPWGHWRGGRMRRRQRRRTRRRRRGVFRATLRRNIPDTRPPAPWPRCTSWWHRGEVPLRRGWGRGRTCGDLPRSWGRPRGPGQGGRRTAWTAAEAEAAGGCAATSVGTAHLLRGLGWHCHPPPRCRCRGAAARRGGYQRQARRQGQRLTRPVSSAAAAAVVAAVGAAWALCPLPPQQRV